ncbi:MAG: hypothetical protein ABI895_40170, partial [Deltaproteobacteria bacterium]
MPISPSLTLAPPRGQCRPFRSRRAAGLGLSLCLVLGWGCAKQAEGERCDLNNGDLDCDTGLVCRGEASSLSIQGIRGAALCCPATGATTVDACRTTPELMDEMLPDELLPAPAPDAGAVTATPEPVVDAGAVVLPDAT